MLSEIMSDMTMIWHESTDFINFENKTWLSSPQESLCFPLFFVLLSPLIWLFLCSFVFVLPVFTYSAFQNIALNPCFQLSKIQAQIHTLICLCLCESAERCATCRSAQQGSVSLQRMLGALPCPACVVLRRLSSVFVAEKHETPHRAAAQRKTLLH